MYNFVGRKFSTRYQLTKYILKVLCGTKVITMSVCSEQPPDLLQLSLSFM